MSTIAGNLMSASVQQSIDWMGEVFTITRKVMIGYDTGTSEASPADTTIVVKGIFDDYRSRNLGESTDVRGDEKAIVMDQGHRRRSAQFYSRHRRSDYVEWPQCLDTHGAAAAGAARRHNVLPIGV